MSDIGLFGSIYEQLREYSDQLDILLLQVQNAEDSQKIRARKKLASLLRTLSDSDNKSPSVQIVRMVLKRELSKTFGNPEVLCKKLADALELRQPSIQELDQLDKMAIAVDSERKLTMDRMRGRA